MVLHRRQVSNGPGGGPGWHRGAEILSWCLRMTKVTKRNTVVGNWLISEIKRISWTGLILTNDQISLILLGYWLMVVNNVFFYQPVDRRDHQSYAIGIRPWQIDHRGRSLSCCTGHGNHLASTMLKKKQQSLVTKRPPSQLMDFWSWSSFEVVVAMGQY